MTITYTPRHRAGHKPRGLSRTLIALGVVALLSPVAAATASAGYSEDITGAWEALDTHDGTGDPYPGTWTPEATIEPSVASTFVDAFNARLSWSSDGPNLGTSFEIADAGFTIDEGAVAYFSYELEDGAVAGGGAPRLFVEVDGVYYNTADHGYAYDDFNAKAIDLPAGEVGHVGIVYDNGVPGSVLVSRPVIDGLGLNFPTAPTTPTEANAFGKEVSTFVKENGGPPPHAKAGK
jgi:hypothetical protein